MARGHGPAIHESLEAIGSSEHGTTPGSEKLPHPARSREIEGGADPRCDSVIFFFFLRRCIRQDAVRVDRGGGRLEVRQYLVFFHTFLEDGL